jgi:hypothetical protein
MDAPNVHKAAFAQPASFQIKHIDVKINVDNKNIRGLI